MKKEDSKSVFVCQSCGHVSAKWLGCCPGCGAWHTFSEEKKGGDAGGRGWKRESLDEIGHIPLSDVKLEEGIERIGTDVSEMDRVLGGGLVPGGLVLLGGEPGIGKSTLLLQLLALLAEKGHRVLYVSGEESAAQIKMRAERLGSISRDLIVACEVDMDRIMGIVEEVSPAVLAIDSIQTLYCKELGSSPGSVGQVREASARLMLMAKKRAMPTIIVGHVTKEGTIAGPRVLEHLVDTVLYFEGDRSHTFRLLRTVKNRFGPTHEIGVFEMSESGLRQVPNPSELFMAQRPESVPGSVVVPCMEGTRPILVEIQALVSPSHLAMPRRTAIGIENSRLALLIAVAEKHLGLTLYDRDIFINVVGGIKISEPAADLGVVLAMISSLREIPLNPSTAVFGEVGLTGEVRSVGKAELRINEASRLGLEFCIMPEVAASNLKSPENFKVLPVKRLQDAVEVLSRP